MENFFRVYSIIISTFFIISFTITALANKDRKMVKTGFILLILYAPVFFYIIKF